MLGGNAFVRPGERLTMAGQFRFAREALGRLGSLLEDDIDLVLSHGNGPQVGHMLIRVEQALGEAYALPLEVCVAESEGELGYVLQQTLHNVLAQRGAVRPVVSLLTQVVVDPDDPAFGRPTKPIGPYYDEERAGAIQAEGFSMVAQPSGFRRVVPSPKPLEIVDVEVVDRLLDLGAVVIAAGGGGIPVVRKGDVLEGVDAVIDKDWSAALLADHIGADTLVILTGVDAVYRDFGTDQAEPLGTVSAAALSRIAEDGHFPEGSMGPKVEAAVDFATRAPGRRAIICDPASLERALAGEAGTIVTA